MEGALLPLVKWAGGKRWLFRPEFKDQLPKFERYIEPFFGGGAGFFAMAPRNAIIADVNDELMNVYRQVRDHPLALRACLKEAEALHCKDFYYAVRQDVPTDPLARAVRTLYLNRTCWNGLYRLNRRGKFNVPIGTKQKVILASDEFVRAASVLKNADILTQDFDATISKASAGDLVFVDPPYTVKHNMNGFVKYNESIFSWEDQVRLRDSCLRAADRGAHVIITNADHSSIKDLYSKASEVSSVPRASIISGRNEGRSETTELLIRI